MRPGERAGTCHMPCTHLGMWQDDAVAALASQPLHRCDRDPEAVPLCSQLLRVGAEQLFSPNRRS